MLVIILFIKSELGTLIIKIHIGQFGLENGHKVRFANCLVVSPAQFCCILCL